LIGLELGVLSSEAHEFKWDGKQYSIEAWNQDHTLRSAIEVSCVPCFQQLARTIGEERMGVALRKLDYGNATIGAPIDVFWLEGGFKISPRQQLEFLYQLQTRALPFGLAAMETTIDLIPKTETGAAILRGKTGMLGSEPPVGWYVGWLEWEKGTTFFATALHGENDRESLPAARRTVTVEALRLFTGLDSLN
jgi:beta-lactamase class D